MISYYEDVLMEMDLNKDEEITCITAHIPKLISEEKNLALMMDITFGEVEEVVKEMLKLIKYRVWMDSQQISPYNVDILLLRKSMHW